MKSILAKKLNIIEIILGIESDEALTVLENEAYRVKDQIASKPNVFEAVKTIRSNVSLQQIMEEQNYKPISYLEFRKLADQLEIEESIEELLAMLTK